jgi:hypothetical protein
MYSTDWRQSYLSAFTARSTEHDDGDTVILPDTWEPFGTTPNAQKLVNDSSGTKFKMGDFWFLTVAMKLLFGFGGLTAAALSLPVVQPDEKVTTLPRRLKPREATRLMNAMQMDGRYVYTAIRDSEGSGWDFAAIPLAPGLKASVVYERENGLRTRDLLIGADRFNDDVT